MKIFKIIVGNLIIFSLVFLFIGNLSSFSDKIYDIVRYRSYVIISGSMEPTINIGDLIITTKVNREDLEVGDIITFDRDGMTATHRIIELNDHELITQGDANNVHDNPIAYEDIIGKYQFAIPKFGHIIQFTTTPTGMILIVTLLLVYGIYEFMIKEK